MANVFEQALDVGEPNRLLISSAIAESSGIVLTTAGHRIRIRANKVATSVTGLRRDLATAVAERRQASPWLPRSVVPECC